jgi:SAM-dependent methyltransferase
MKQSAVSQYLSHQQAPSLLLKFPRLLHLYFRLNRLSVLRMKYAHRAIRTVLEKYGTPRSVVDAGCGMGDYLFTVPEFRRAERLTGIDVSGSNIDLCRRLAEADGRSNMQFVCSDLASAVIEPKTDLLLCIGVLMYIREDASVLKKFHEALSEDGTLVLYAALNYRRNLSFYKRLARNPGFDYDEIIGRPQTYTDASLRSVLTACGFIVVEERLSFGVPAAIMFEISAIFEWYFKSLHPVLTVFLLPLYLLFYPLYLITMEADVRGSRTTGNGVMIIAKKTGKDIVQ